MRYSIAQLIDLPQLQQLMETLSAATGINHALIDNDSVVHTAVGWQEICTDFHRVNARSCERCLESDRHILEHLKDGPYVGYRCPQGLFDYATPVIVEGEHLANIFTGQMLHEPPDVDFFRHQAGEFGFDESRYLAALAKVRIVPREQMPAVMAFQVQLAQMLASKGLVQQRRLEAEEELRRLNRDLLERVAARTGELNERNRQLSDEVAQRRRAEEEIRHFNDQLAQRVAERTAELEAANRELEEFSYSISHDLRTPLRAIAGFAQILVEEHAGGLDSESRRLLDVVRTNTVRMGRLIDGLLEFLSLGRRPMERGPVATAQLAEEVFAELQGAVPERRLRLELKSPPPAWGDPGMIRRLLANLLSNAIKFTGPREQAVIEVGGTSGGSENRYYVKDNGVGFDMKYVDKLLRVFEHPHPAGRFEGSGTGLAMAKRIVGRHGGRVWAEGQVDAGATFHFTLPAEGESHVATR